MTDLPAAPVSPRPAGDTPARRARGNPASAIYGSIVAAGLVAAQGAAGYSTPQIVTSMFGSLAVFWLAHVYTDVMASPIETGRFDRHHIGHVLREEWPIFESGMPPAVVLVAGAMLGLSVNASVTLALVVTVLELLGWALLACRRMALPPGKAVPYVVIAALFGIAIIGLKLLVH